MFGAILEALVPSRQMYDQSYGTVDMAPWSDFWFTPLGLPQTSGAATVNSQYFVSGCFAATRLLCAIGSTSPLNLMRKTTVNGRTKRTIEDQHPAHKILNFRANDEQTSVQWRSQNIAWQVNLGTGLSEVQRDLITDELIAVHSIHPRRTRPFRTKSGELWWHINNPGAESSDLPDRELLRFPYIISEDGGVTGLGVATQAVRAIGLSQTMERSETQASKAGVPRIVVEVENKMSPEARAAFRREWKELYEQGGEAVALLTEKAVAKPLDWKMTDQQHKERREFLVEELARWYDIPLNMLRRAIKELSGNVEQQGIDFRTYSLRFLDVWLQELAYKLLTQEEIKAGYYFAFDFSDLLRGDLAALSEFYSSMFNISVFSPNQILDKLGENPYDGGDERYVQGAMRPYDEPYNALEPQNVKTDPKKGKSPVGAMVNIKDIRPSNESAERAVKILMHSTLQRMANKEMQAATAQAKKAGTFLPAMEEFYAKHTGTLTDALSPICLAAAELGNPINAEQIAAEWCRISMNSLLEISGTATASNLSEKIGETILTWNSERVQTKVAAITTAA